MTHQKKNKKNKLISHIKVIVRFSIIPSKIKICFCYAFGLSATQFVDVQLLKSKSFKLWQWVKNKTANSYLILEIDLIPKNLDTKEENHLKKKKKKKQKRSRFNIYTSWIVNLKTQNQNNDNPLVFKTYWRFNQFLIIIKDSNILWEFEVRLY